MASPIQTEIYKTIEKLESLKSIHRHYEETMRLLQENNKSLEVLNNQLDKELKDIEKLEGVSIKGLFHHVLGSKEEQAEKERQEYLELSLKHQEMVKEIELLEYELSVLDKKISNIDKLEERLSLLKGKREDEILRSPSHMRQELLRIHQEIDDIKGHASELMEAYRAGEAVRQSVTMIVNYLKEASKWGDWDKMSKSRYYDRKKYDSIDRAINEGYKSRQLLAIFSRELNDVGMRIGNISIEIGEFGRFMDQLFDNLITDWVVQNKINHSLNAVQHTLTKITGLVNTLRSKMNTENDKIKKLETEKDQLLIS